MSFAPPPTFSHPLVPATNFCLSGATVGVLLPLYSIKLRKPVGKQVPSLKITFLNMLKSPNDQKKIAKTSGHLESGLAQQGIVLKVMETYWKLAYSQNTLPYNWIISGCTANGSALDSGLRIARHSCHNPADIMSGYNLTQPCGACGVSSRQMCRTT